MSGANHGRARHSGGAGRRRRGRASCASAVLLGLTACLISAAALAQEPTRQPAANAIFLWDPNAADTSPELQISWSRGDGDGVLVLMRQGLPVDSPGSDPVDGTTYTANAAFGSGSEIGTGAFVVSAGAATSVTVTNLQSEVPYFLALYAYDIATADYLTAVPAAKKTSGHNASHTIDCSECHFDPVSGAFHGGDIVPRDSAQATVCKTCHNATGPASGKAAVDLHTGPNFTTVVDCGSCHNVHNTAFNQVATDTHTGGVTAANRNWIRTNTTKYIAAAQEPALFQGRCTGNGALSCDSDQDCQDAGAGTCDSSGFFGFDDSSSPWNGLCQNCHTQTGTTCCGGPRHTNDSVGAADHVHQVGANCTACHTHEGQDGVEDGFTPQGGSCTDCHNQPREIGTTNTFRRQILEGTSSRCSGDGATICTTDGDCTPTPGGVCTNGEFGVDFTSHHVNDGTGTQIATKWDCVVCHAEGDVLTGEPDPTYHQTDGVQLKNLDDPNTVYSDWATLTTAGQRTEFCLSCHDADGANLVASRPATPPDPNDPDVADYTNDALNPFNDGVTNAHEPDGFTSMCEDLRTTCSRDRDCSGIGGGTCNPLTAPHARGRCSTTSVIACGTAYECPSGETCEFLKVVDVFAQFDPNNPSHHAVRVQAYTSATPHGSNVDNAIQGVRTDLAWDSILDCEDCHYGPPGIGLSAHGTANARYMLRDKDGNDTLPAPLGSGNLNVNCFRCHISTGDPASYDETLSTYTEHVQGAHIDDTRNLFGISCLNCHGGAEFGGIHGMDGPVTDDDGGGSYNPNVFTWGSALDLISTWAAGASVTCSARADSTLLSNCTQHSTKTATNWRSGSQTRTYREP